MTPFQTAEPLKMKEAIAIAKDFLSTEAGFYKYSLELDEVEDSKDGWIITFYHKLGQEETMCEVKVSKETKDVVGFRRVPVEEEDDEEATN